MKARDKTSPFPVFRPYKEGDIDFLDLLDVYDDDHNAKERCKNIAQAPFCQTYTILDETGMPLAVAGGFFMYSRVMEIWTLVDKRMKKKPKFYAHAMKFLVEHQFDMLRLERMQVIMRADQPWAKSWARFLGFELEGTLRKYGEENTDYYLFSKVR